MLKVVNDEAEPIEASGSVLDEIVREPARQLLAVALQAEVSAYIDAHAEEVDEQGHRLVIRNRPGHSSFTHFGTISVTPSHGEGQSGATRLTWTTRTTTLPIPAPLSQ